jgi:hypothetical protein
MMHDDADETILRIGSALRPLPDVDPSKVARVLVAVAAERERDRELAQRRRTVRRWSAAGGVLAAAALFVAVALKGPQAGEAGLAALPPAGATAATSVAAAPETQLAARPADGVVAQPVQLVFRAPAAHRVSIVGDFNGWNSSASVMTRDPASGLWSGTLLLRPGRHVYAFVVDDSIWARDPRQPAATDPDFGRPGSVLLVGRP